MLQSEAQPPKLVTVNGYWETILQNSRPCKASTSKLFRSFCKPAEQITIAGFVIQWKGNEWPYKFRKLSSDCRSIFKTFLKFCLSLVAIVFYKSRKLVCNSTHRHYYRLQIIDRSFCRPWSHLCAVEATGLIPQCGFDYFNLTTDYKLKEGLLVV